MSGTRDATIHVRVLYLDPWIDDEARRLIQRPALEEMAKACEEIADRYSHLNISVRVV
jgi:tRNA G46 methylase TrmB